MSRIPKIAELAKGYKPPSVIVVLGGREVTVYKMSLMSFTKAVKQAEPYIKEMASGLFGSATFQKALRGEVDVTEGESEMRSTIMIKIGELIATVPETVLSIVACIMNINPDTDTELSEFFWNEVEPLELFACIEKLDELNDFVGLANKLLEAWGYLCKRYGIELSGLEVIEKEKAEQVF